MGFGVKMWVVGVVLCLVVVMGSLLATGNEVVYVLNKH
jgi:hypothetical protein